MNDNLVHFDGPTFEAQVLNASEPVVVDFYADWCPPCKMMEPVVHQLAEEFEGKVVFVDPRVQAPGPIH